VTLTRHPWDVTEGDPRATPGDRAPRIADRDGQSVAKTLAFLGLA